MWTHLSLATVIAVSATLVLTGCTAKARLLTETKAYGGSLEVKINVQPSTSGTLQFKGVPAFEKLGPIAIESGAATVNVPLAGIPKGKTKVGMEFTGVGHGLAKKVVGKDDLVFDRVAIIPSLKLVPVAKSGVPTVRAKGSLVDSDALLPFGPDCKLSVDLTQCDGCDVAVGDQKIPVRGPHAVAAIDLTSAIADAKAPTYVSSGDLEIVFKILLEGETTSVPLETSSSRMLGNVFLRVAQGPLALSGDVPTAAPKAAVFVRKDGYGAIHNVGTAAKVRDYVLVGLVTTTESSLGSCGVYATADKKTKTNVAHVGLTYDVSMIDRRSGKSLGRRTFAPENRDCGDTLVGGAKVVHAWPATESLDAWARTFFK